MIGHPYYGADPNAMVVFTDLDVVPIQPYGRLLADVPAEREVTWMYNHQKHAPANTGFMLARNTPNVRAFLDLWLAKSEVAAAPGLEAGHDQRQANKLLFELLQRKMALNWSTFPPEIIPGGSTWLDTNGPPPSNSTKDVPWVTLDAVAFHAIGHESMHTKLVRVEQLLQTLRRIASERAATASAAGRPAAEPDVWQTPCHRAAAEESCRVAPPTGAAHGNRPT